eukprot:GHVT01002510.1.p2 GENE.GHVT01002510.1~~GHVT01002510.1.p2  ORF type:complete len:185 (-),score=8.39 GHVT01002510.1:457-1011(-)
MISVLSILKSKRTYLVPALCIFLGLIVYNSAIVTAEKEIVPRPYCHLAPPGYALPNAGRRLARDSRVEYVDNAVELRGLILTSKLPMLIAFVVEWCPSSRHLMPYLDQVSVKFDGLLRVLAVNYDTTQHDLQDFAVNGLPTLVALWKTQETYRFVGTPGFEQMSHEMFTVLGDIQRRKYDGPLN